LLIFVLFPIILLKIATINNLLVEFKKNKQVLGLIKEAGIDGMIL